jgi:phage terminase small subunit
MGGIGSGGSNRKSTEEHKKRGTFHPYRHKERIGEVVPIPQRHGVPTAPSHLGPQGLQLWTELWEHMTGLDPQRDYALVAMACEGRDQVMTAYKDWLESGTDGKGKQVRARDPKLGRMLAELRKGWRQDMALLGMSARDRAAMTRHAPPESSLEQMKRKVLQLRRPG